MKGWKGAWLGLTALSLLSAPAAAEAAAAKINIKIDGQAQVYDTAPYMKNDRTLVPLRGIFEKLGAEVFWKEETSTVYAVKGDLNIVLPIGSKQATVNGQTVQLDQPAEVTSGRTMVPIRFVSETLGAGVLWEQKSNSVVITSGVKPLPKGGQALHLPLSYEFVLDPSLAGDPESLTVLAQVGEGLTRLDQDGNAVPGAASSWTVSPDGKTYRFTLRDTAKWSDGTAVTAHDFEYSWKRTLNLKSEASYAFMLTDTVKGAMEYYDGRGSAAAVGVKALNNQTLEVTLLAPTPSFPEQLVMPVFYPLKKQMVEGKGVAYGTDVKDTLFNGPFKMTVWAHDQYALLQKNGAYWDRSQVRLEKVNYYIAKNDLTALYNQGKLDRIPVSAANYSTYQNHPHLSLDRSLVTSYLQFDSDGVLIDNKKVRQGLAYAIDAQALLDAIGANGPYEVATGLVPKGITNGEGGPYRSEGEDPLQRQAKLQTAKALLQEGLDERYGLGEYGSNIWLLMHDSSFARKVGAELKKQWWEKLGINTLIEYVPLAEKLKRLAAGDYDVTFAQWNADYDDPGLFLDLYKSDSFFNDSSFASAEYDELLNRALQEPDLEKRMVLYREAEELLLEEHPVSPLFFSNQAYLTQPYVKNWRAVPGMAVNYDLKLTYIEGK